VRFILTSGLLFSSADCPLNLFYSLGHLILVTFIEHDMIKALSSLLTTNTLLYRNTITVLSGKEHIFTFINEIALISK
jgi:hypothetical protein